MLNSRYNYKILKKHVRYDTIDYSKFKKIQKIKIKLFLINKM